VGEKTPTRCVVVNQVQSGKFVRLFPKKKGTFDCSESNAFSIKLNID
jgi:hypothetical protein